jgi:histone-lysine N-methyltransferase EZH2
MVTDSHVMIGEDNMRKEEFVDENICKQELTDNKSWKALEKGLLEKGMEIFGKNRSDMFELEMCYNLLT